MKVDVTKTCQDDCMHIRRLPYDMLRCSCNSCHYEKDEMKELLEEMEEPED